MSIILNAIEKEEQIIHFEKIYPIIDVINVSYSFSNAITINKDMNSKDMNSKDMNSKDMNGKENNEYQMPKIEYMDRDSIVSSIRNSDLETVDEMNDPLIQTKPTYCTSFDFVFCCFAICL